MSDKQTTSTATAADVLPKSSKGNKSELELYLDAISKADAHKAGVIGDFQRRIAALATDKKLLEGKGLIIDWTSPDFTTALTDLGLQPIVQETKRTPKTPKTNGKVEYREGTVKAKVMDALKDGSTLDVDQIAKATKLDKKQLPIALGQMKNKDGTITSPERGKYKVK